MKTGSMAGGKMQNYTRLFRIPSASKNPSVPELGTGQERVSRVPGPSVNIGILAGESYSGGAGTRITFSVLL